MQLLNYVCLVIVPMVPAAGLWWLFGALNAAGVTDKNFQAYGPIAGYIITLVLSYPMFRKAHSEYDRLILSAHKRRKMVMRELKGTWAYDDELHSMDGVIKERGVSVICVDEVDVTAMYGSSQDEHNVRVNQWQADQVYVENSTIDIIYSVPALHGRAPRRGLMRLVMIRDDEGITREMRGDYAVLGLPDYGTIVLKKSG